ncbi:hypothetical protein GCM10010497_00890 [Streptomyces cinereoruber]|uniref:Uncharacterized protein n=1 Tax=Streptomyces cinereoruber TaxID=67260 RepID=A0AAV4KBY2_9ACTN|nr:hypothetical protein GCM10010497_00890 [Streptomyces cinereoruber]
MPDRVPHQLRDQQDRVLGELRPQRPLAHHDVLREPAGHPRGLGTGRQPDVTLRRIPVQLHCFGGLFVVRGQ